MSPSSAADADADVVADADAGANADVDADANADADADVEVETERLAAAAVVFRNAAPHAVLTATPLTKSRRVIGWFMPRSSVECRLLMFLRLFGRELHDITATGALHFPLDSSQTDAASRDLQ